MEVLAAMVGWLLPIVLLIVLVRAIAHRGHKGEQAPKGFSYRDLMLAIVGTAAAYAGGVAIYYLPAALFGVDADNAVFASRLAIGVLFLAIGLSIRHVTGVFLMIMGLTSFVLAAPFVFNNLGSAGALIAAVIVFAVLVVLAVRVSKKAEHSG